MKGVHVFVVLLGLAVAAGAATPSPAPSPESRTCVPDKWQGLSFTTAEGKHKAILAKSAVDVHSQKAATEFIVLGHHHHHHDHHHHHHRDDLAPKATDMLEGFEPGRDFGKHKGVVKVIADFAKEKVYFTFHKKTDDQQITFCKVKDFDHPVDLSTALCLPERAKKGGDIVLGGSLNVDMYFFKAKKSIVQVSLAEKNNFPVSVTAVKKCGKGAAQTVYFNITKDIDEGFFEVPASCEGKVEADLSFDKYFEHIRDTLKHQTLVGNPISKFFGGADSHQAEDEHSETVMDKLASIWHGLFGSQQKDNEFVSAPKIMMYGRA